MLFYCLLISAFTLASHMTSASGESHYKCNGQMEYFDPKREAQLLWLMEKDCKYYRYPMKKLKYSPKLDCALRYVYADGKESNITWSPFEVTVDPKNPNPGDWGFIIALVKQHGSWFCWSASTYMPNTVFACTRYVVKERGLWRREEKYGCGFLKNEYFY